jgi:hypothetical protein
MLSAQGIAFLQRQIEKNISHGLAIVNGAQVRAYKYEINKKNSILQIKLKFDESVVGRITEYRLVLKTGETFMTKSENMVKDNKRSHLVLFELETKEA